MNRLKKSLSQWELANITMVPTCYFINVKMGAQWLYRYTIHGHRHEMGLDALRNVSFKKASERATQ